METQTHKIVDILNHLWPWLAGVVAVIIGSTRLWWRDRRDTKKRIRSLELLAQHFVTMDELRDCRDEVKSDDDKNLNMIFKEIRDNARINASQHQDIMKQIIKLHED